MNHYPVKATRFDTKTIFKMNLNQTFAVLFWLNKAKVNSKGLVPIWIRITVDGKRAECSTQKQINPDYWNNEKNRVGSNEPNHQAINDFLLMIQAEITKHYNGLLSMKEYVTAEDVKNSYKGVKETKRTLLEIFKQYNHFLSEKVEIDDLSKRRYERYQLLYRKCKAFIKAKLKKQDVFLEEVKLNFIVEFEHHLRLTEKLHHNTAMKYAKDLKQVMKYAVMLEYIQSNPFEFFKCTFKKTKREILTSEELEILYKKEFKIKRLEEVRDCYLFSCYTGYAYADAEALSLRDVTTGIDGTKWIIRDRIKTDTIENVPLLPIALEIIEKYKNNPYCQANDKLLPINTNQRYNAYLKEIADICGIAKNLTTHTARHTFATTILLSNDVPMETAMELLGHTDIRTTQIYGKIVQKKVSKDMNALREKLSGKVMAGNQKTESV